MLPKHAINPEKKAYKGIQGKLKPNQHQKQLIEQNFAGARQAWNVSWATYQKMQTNYAYVWGLINAKFRLPEYLASITPYDKRNSIEKYYVSHQLNRWHKTEFYEQTMQHKYHLTHPHLNRLYSYDINRFRKNYIYQAIKVRFIRKHKNGNLVKSKMTSPYAYQYTQRNFKDSLNRNLCTQLLTPLHVEAILNQPAKKTASKQQKTTQAYISYYKNKYMQFINQHLNATDQHIDYLSYLEYYYISPYIDRKAFQVKSIKKNLTRFDLMKNITKTVKKPIYAHLKACDSMALRNAADDLNTTIQNMYKQDGLKHGAPHFKSWREPHQSYRSTAIMKKDKHSKQVISSNVQIMDAHHIKIPKLGIVRCDKIRRNVSNMLIKTITISRDDINNYQFSLAVEYESNPWHKTNQITGFDVNIENFMTDSNGVITPTIHYDADNAKVLYWQRKADRLRRHAKQAEHDEKMAIAKARHSKLGSLAPTDYKHWYEYRNYQWARHLWYKAKVKQTNRRRMALHKLSTQIVRDNDVLVFENLKVANMVKNHHLAKAIQNQGWATFLTMVKQKCDAYGKQVIIVDPKKTTQICNDCGYEMGSTNADERLTLDQRDWTCPQCGEYHIRDLNAARNIRDRGIDQLKRQTK